MTAKGREEVIGKGVGKMARDGRKARERRKEIGQYAGRSKAENEREWRGKDGQR